MSIKGNKGVKLFPIDGLVNKFEYGVKLAIIPKSNLNDIPKIKERNPNLIDKDFEVISVENINQVLEHVLV